MNREVDAYIDRAKSWQPELKLLRTILLDCGLLEEYKWRQPCYTYDHNNVIILSPFKDYCALNIIKGSLLEDAEGRLTKPGENTQGGRQFRFTSLKEIKELEAIIKAYIYEAIEVARAGLKVPSSDNTNLDFPDELLEIMESKPDFKAAFESLTPGRQRAYNILFTGAKQSATRTTRIKKYIPRIMDGFGFNDCVCGHSKRMPNCDGSHKNFE